jgi:hypothetical protein
MSAETERAGVARARTRWLRRIDIQIRESGTNHTLVPGSEGGSRPSRDIAGDYGWCRVGKAAEAFRRWHGVYSALPTRLALGPIGGPVRVGKGGPQIGALTCLSLIEPGRNSAAPTSANK